MMKDMLTCGIVGIGVSDGGTMKTGKYVLNEDGQPVICEDVRVWAEWFEHHPEQRIVARDAVGDDIVVSTVFLGLDHNWSGGPPVLWETMIFGGPDDEYQERYTSQEAALAGHATALARVLWRA